MPISIEEIEKTKISKVSLEDITDILRLAQETYISRWTADAYLSEIENKLSVALSIKNGAELCGFLIARLIIFESKAIDIKEAEILNIAVFNKFQRKGFGQKLLEEFFKIAEHKNVSEIWLEVRASNLQAINFYEKNGFLKEFERKNYYTEPLENALVMKKTIVSNDLTKL